MASRIFLSHNSKDKSKVKPIAERLHNDPALEAAGLEVFLDEWHLVPGRDLIKELEIAIKDSCVAVCFQGPHGDGPYQSEEIGNLLRRSAKGKCRVVPVLLRGATEEQLDGFLGNRLAVKYSGRGSYARLVAGILDQALGPPSKLVKHNQPEELAVAKARSSPKPVKAKTSRKTEKAESKKAERMTAKGTTTRIRAAEEKSSTTKSPKVSSSKNLFLLGDDFYMCNSCRETSGGSFGGSEVAVTLRVGAPAVARLKTALRMGSSISYAYQNLSGTGSVRDHQIETKGRSTTVTLSFTTSHQSMTPSLIPSYSDGTRRLSSNDIATQAAREILLNEQMDPMLWGFFGNSLHYRHRPPGSPLRAFMTRVTPDKLRKARLVAVRELLSLGVVSEISELSFTIGAREGVRVRFQGQLRGMGREEIIKVSGVFGEAAKSQ